MTRTFKGLAAVRALEGLRLGVDFVGGGSAVVDLGPWVGSIGPLQRLRDPALFATARVAYEGAGVAWGEVVGDEGEGAIDMDGEQLWRFAGEQAGRFMPVDEFRAWRARHGLSRAEAADVLGVSRRTLAAYEDGMQPIPRTVMLACRGWDAVAAEAA